MFHYDVASGRQIVWTSYTTISNFKAKFIQILIDLLSNVQCFPLMCQRPIASTLLICPWKRGRWNPGQLATFSVQWKMPLTIFGTLVYSIFCSKNYSLKVKFDSKRALQVSFSWPNWPMTTEIVASCERALTPVRVNSCWYQTDVTRGHLSVFQKWFKESKHHF
jgi:hypothetical protein